MSELEGRIGFLCWNPFQFLHFAPVAALLPGAIMVVESRKRHRMAFTDELMADRPFPTVFWPRERLAAIDGHFDVVVAQTASTQLASFRESQIAMLQYGYAKAPHNYGSWRALADLTLTYGPAADRAISQYCPTEVVGVPRFDHWEPFSEGPSSTNAVRPAAALSSDVWPAEYVRALCRAHRRTTRRVRRRGEATPQHPSNGA